MKRDDAETEVLNSCDADTTKWFGVEYVRVCATAAYIITLSAILQGPKICIRSMGLKLLKFKKSEREDRKNSRRVSEKGK
jgi:hypothetical protein